MQPSDIASITFELIRLQHDRLLMSWEDDKSHCVAVVAKLKKLNDYRHAQISTLTKEYKQLAEIMSDLKHQGSSRKRCTEIPVSKSKLLLEETVCENFVKPSKVDSISKKPRSSEMVLEMPRKNDTSIQHPTTDSAPVAKRKYHISGNNIQSPEASENVVELTGVDSISKQARSFEMPRDDSKSIQKSANRTIGRRQTTGMLNISLPSKSNEKKSVTSSSSSKSGIRRCGTVSEVKCVEVVRNRNERAALPGHSCDECSKYYEALKQQGIFTEEDRQEMMATCSRHKSKWAPKGTPEGFWDLTVRTPEDWK